MTLSELFQYPPAEYRAKPFWAWNGELEENELREQIHAFDQMGFGGYFCHSRIGLKTEYLGREWFEAIEACTEEGAARGMETWLYDEDRWPSGSVGGLLVRQHPEHAMKFLRMSRADAKTFSWREDIVAAFSVQMEGVVFWDKKRFDSGHIPERGTVLYFTV